MLISTQCCFKFRGSLVYFMCARIAFLCALNEFALLIKKYVMMAVNTVDMYAQRNENQYHIIFIPNLHQNVLQEK